MSTQLESTSNIQSLTALSRPEIELLLCCARTQTNRELADRIQQLVQQDIDWQYFVATAQYHGIVPLIYGQLQGFNTVPAEVRSGLEKAFNKNAYINMSLTGELIKIQNLLKSQAIPMLAFKGPVLAQLAYNNIAARQFVDLDILVPSKDVSKASQLLREQGYQPQFNFTEAQEQLYVKVRSEHSFWHPEKEICVDLHWSILPKYFSFSPEEKFIWDWENRDRVSLGKNKVDTLSKENLLLYLCAHSAKHNWSHLNWICDLAELLRSHPDMDWELILARTGKLGTRRMLFLGLALARDLFGAMLPEKISQQIESDSEIISLSQQVRSGLFQTETRLLGEFPVANIYLKTMSSVRDKLWYWYDAIITPTPLEWAMISLPKWLGILYYPLRLMRLIIKYVGGELSN
ncbi:MAG: nucleotidyltransferase family protein [Hormoscilla sp.]